MRREAGGKFDFGECGVCMERDLVFGEDKRSTPGVPARLCRKCWPHTLAWVQMSEEQRWTFALRWMQVASIIATALVKKAEKAS